MAWADAYATKEEYKARVRKSTSGDDTAITAQLLAVSRHLEIKMGTRSAPRVFNQTAPATARVFDGSGRDRLRIDDAVTLTAVAVDTARDGTFGTAVDAADYLTLPINAVALLRPITYLRLRSGAPSIITGGYTSWPGFAQNVRVTGTWGWPAVPEMIKELTILITRQIRDLQESGITVTVQALDGGGVQMAPGASSLMKEAIRAYSRKPLVF